VISDLSRLTPLTQTLLALGVLALAAAAAGAVLRWLLPRSLAALRQRLASPWALIVLHHSVLLRLARVAPSLVVQWGIQAVPWLQPQWAQLLRNVAVAFTIYHVAHLLGVLLDVMNDAHDEEQLRQTTQTRSIKSYVQLGKLLIALIALVLIAATLANRSPLLLLSGLGAASAVLMLVFKDTILSFVAGVQLGLNDMLRVGDWIEMPQAGADGFVIDIALNTVKVQNWDKTITTIPTWRLMNESYKNWRGMFESGGRRICRALNIDGNTVGLLTDEQTARLARLALLQDYFAQAQPLCQIAPGESGADLACARQGSNLAAFKAYALAYLLHHPRIHKASNMALMVRTMEATALGLPLQLFCYTNTTAWVEYEGIQGDIFDHLISMLPQFGLALYQRSSDYGVHDGSRDM